MGVLQVILIIIGVTFIIGSFFATEKLSKKDLEKISLLSEAELKIVTERQLQEAKNKIETTIDDIADEISNKSERLMEKESNEKIMAISEYSDTVLESINKTHNEIMFLYSMLNDKYTELTDYVNEVSSLKGEIEQYSNSFVHEVQETEHEIKEEVTTKVEESIENTKMLPQEEKEDVLFHKDKILELYHEGISEVEIARTLALGIGAVRLVIELYNKEQ